MTTPRRRSLSLAHRLREPTVASTTDAGPPLLLLLHGVGSNELSMAALADRFDPRFLVISARSPIEVGPFAFAWVHVTETPQGPVVDADEAEKAWQRVAAFTDEVVDAYGADPRRVFIAGFSQGGIMAIAAMLTSPERYVGAVCMSGRLLHEVLPHAVEASRLRGKRVLIVHGTNDEKLPVAYARDAIEVLSRFPLTTTYREFDMGHTADDLSLAVVSTWLTTSLDA